MKDLQREFEIEREEYLDTIRKQEKQLKLLAKLSQKIHSFVPHDCNYYNLDKVQTISIWNEEAQDWTVPEMKREKLSLPTMGGGGQINGNHRGDEENDFYDESLQDGGYAAKTNALLQNRRNTMQNMSSSTVVAAAATNGDYQDMGSYAVNYSREPEVDRLRIKLESSQFNGNNYFKNKRQSELLSQTQEMKNLGGNRLSPLGQPLPPRAGGNSNWKPYS